MVRFLGKGGCLSVEYSYCLASLIKDKEDLSSIVRKYDRLRNSRSRWIQKRSKLQGIFNHISNPILAKIRNLFAKIIMNNSVNKLHSYNLIKELSELKKI